MKLHLDLKVNDNDARCIAMRRRYFFRLFFSLGSKRLYEELLRGVEGPPRSRFLWVGPWIDSWMLAILGKQHPRS